jgi:hypothetical protein
MGKDLHVIAIARSPVQKNNATIIAKSLNSSRFLFIRRAHSRNPTAVIARNSNIPHNIVSFNAPLETREDGNLYEDMKRIEQLVIQEKEVYTSSQEEGKRWVSR